MLDWFADLAWYWVTAIVAVIAYLVWYLSQD
ncbi:hypothetical protein ES708_16316 [subsurface metagenome]